MEMELRKEKDNLDKKEKEERDKLEKDQRERRDNIEKEQRERIEKKEKEQRERREQYEKENARKFNILHEYFSKAEINARNLQENECKIIPLNEVPDNQKAENKKEENKNKEEGSKKVEKGHDFQNLRKRNRNDGNDPQNWWIWFVFCLNIYNYFIIWVEKNY